ncbi:MAG: ABC transporter permease [Bacteroidota bacterium]|jgi:ABC-2 type transport system permease protein|nr:ABC transporter permease [Chitinophagaceae bacterium]MCE2759104.1 ABC transporter permease [Chitinophagaceae bacterium]
MSIWKLLEIELYKISKRPRTYISFAAISAIVLIFQFAFKADGENYMNLMLQGINDSFQLDKQQAMNGYFMCYIILNTLLVQVPILVALVAGDAISGEANMGTLRLLLSKPISRTEILIAKFLASVVYTIILLIWMALFALVLSLWIFGSGDMLVFRVAGEVSQIMQIAQDDIVWRYLAAFGYAAVALTVIASLAVFLSLFAENSIGPIITTICIVLVFTIVSNMNIPVIDTHVKPFLFTSYLVGWKGFFYIATTEDGIPIKGSIEDIQSIQRSLMILVGHIGLLLLLSIYIFKRKDILS